MTDRKPYGTGSRVQSHAQINGFVAGAGEDAAYLDGERDGAAFEREKMFSAIDFAELAIHSGVGVTLL